MSRQKFSTRQSAKSVAKIWLFRNKVVFLPAKRQSRGI